MKPRLIIGSLAAAFVLIGIVVYNFPPNEYSFYPRCPFYAVTHWLCPGCGATRALYFLLHGNLGAALHYNAMFTLLMPVFAAWFAFCCYHAVRYDRLPRLVLPRTMWAGMAVAALLFAVVRNTLFVF